jgi:histidinol dehydrogenase
MKVSRFKWDGGDPERLAREIRALQPQLGEVTDAVAEIVAAVESGGDEAVIRFEKKHGGVAPEALQVSAEELSKAPSAIPGEIVGAIEVAIENLTEHLSGAGAAVASTADSSGSMRTRSVPLAAIGAYVPGGAGAYPSTAVMCCVPARFTGVDRIAVATPPGPDGKVNPLVLAACALAGATDVYAMGGAQAIAALALGTDKVWPVDMIVGPGNRYVQEAKRQVQGRVGIDGIAGPSELMVIADERSNLPNLALDLCAQAEHGDDGLLVACAEQAGVLSELQALVEEFAGTRETVKDAPLALVTAPSTEAAVELVNAIAPEHVQLASADAEELAESVRFAGCVFVGPCSATAFGDYAAGTNHVLPTGGAGRFMGPLGAETFRRRITTVELTPEAVEELAPAVATLANAEGFPVHGESAQARVRKGKGE